MINYAQSSLALPGVPLSVAEGECRNGCRSMVIPTAQCQFHLSLILINDLNGYKIPCKRDALARLLDIFCTDCLSSISTYYTCTGPNISNTIQLYCSRHADSTFCPIKIMEESTRRTSAGPLCSTQSYPNTSCNSNCEDYRLLSSRLGCCGGTWSSNYALSGFKKYFDFCNVKNESSCEQVSGAGVPFFNSCNMTLDGPCEPASGAGVLYLSMLLVVAASLLSTIIV